MRRSVKVILYLGVIVGLIGYRHYPLLLAKRSPKPKDLAITYPSIPPNLKVQFVSPVRTQQVCRALDSKGNLVPGQKTDNGEDLTDDMVIAGCYKGSENKIIINTAYPCVIYHELCHAAQRTPKECYGVRVRCSGELNYIQYDEKRTVTYARTKLTKGFWMPIELVQ